MVEDHGGEPYHLVSTQSYGVTVTVWTANTKCQRSPFVSRSCNQLSKILTSELPMMQSPGRDMSPSRGERREQIIARQREVCNEGRGSMYLMWNLLDGGSVV